MLPKTRLLAVGLLSAIVFAVLGMVRQSGPAPSRDAVGLFTSLPVMWGEGEGVTELLAKQQTPRRVRDALAQVGPVKALDTLDGLGPDLKRLVIAQPRPLSPAENVALDKWLREGGKLLLVADPMLTENSSYPVGDPRRPQDIVLLSPILRHWGLELTFDDRQLPGLRTIAVAGAALPVNLAGAWRAANTGCVVEGQGLLVTCRIGQGHLVAMADAEIMTADDPDRVRGPALAGLLDRAFRSH